MIRARLGLDRRTRSTHPVLGKLNLPLRRYLHLAFCAALVAARAQEPAQQPREESNSVTDLELQLDSEPMPAQDGPPPTDEEIAALIDDLPPELLDDLIPALPKWQRFYTVRAGAGYKDNVLLSDFNRQHSPYVSSGVDFFASRLPDEFGQADFFASFEDTRYLKSIDVDSEQLAYARVNYARVLGSGTRAELPLQYIYLNQVTDVSATEADLDVLKVRGHSIQIEPVVRLESGSARPWRAEARFELQRQFLDSPLDNYWEMGPALGGGRRYGHQSDLFAEYQFTHRDYDSNEALDREGFVIPGTSRAFKRHEAEAQWRHYWDAANRWRSTTRLSWQLNDDNASGYFDYQRYRASHQLRFKGAGWTLSAETRYSIYDYRYQTVSDTDDDRRKRRELSVLVEMQRQLTRRLQIYARYEREMVRSNLDAEDYTANTYTGGLHWDFQ